MTDLIGQLAAKLPGPWDAIVGIPRGGLIVASLLGYELEARCSRWRNREVLPFMHKGERAFADALGCPWMTAKEGRQAVPPAFTTFIGEQWLAHLGVTA